MLGEKDMNKESKKLKIRYSPDADVLLISINNEKQNMEKKYQIK